MTTPDPPDRRPLTVLDLMILVAGLALGLALWRAMMREVDYGESAWLVRGSLWGLATGLGLAAAGPLVVVRGWFLTHRFRCSTGEWAWALAGLGWGGVLAFLWIVGSDWVLGLVYGAYGLPRLLATATGAWIGVGLVAHLARFRQRIRGRVLVRWLGLLVAALPAAGFYTARSGLDRATLLGRRMDEVVEPGDMAGWQRLFSGGTDASVLVTYRHEKFWRVNPYLDELRYGPPGMVPRTLPLHVAAAYGPERAVAYLLDRGAAANGRDSIGQTPLHLAACNRQTGAAERLLARGADAEAVDHYGRRVLHQAALRGSTEIMAHLVEHGADVNARTRQQTQPTMAGAQVSPLHLVAFLGTLSGWVPDRPRRAEDYWGIRDDEDRPGFASRSEVADWLLAHGADVNVRTASGVTPLHLAVKTYRPKTVQVLVRYGAHVNTADGFGYRAVHMAAAALGDKKGPSMLTLLLGAGADIDARTKRGRTALHVAARQGHARVVGLLIARGADVNAKDKAGKTPLEMAIEAGHANVAELLRRHGEL